MFTIKFLGHNQITIFLLIHYIFIVNITLMMVVGIKLHLFFVQKRICQFGSEALYIVFTFCAKVVTTFVYDHITYTQTREKKKQTNVGKRTKLHKKNSSLGTLI